MDTILDEALRALKAGETILYPSDTVWGLACDATNEKAVQRIFKIKKRALNKSVLVQIASLVVLNNYAFIPENIENILKQYQRPTTVVYPYKQGLVDLVVAKDKTIAARIPKDEFSLALLQKFKKPIVSTSANISTKLFPIYFKDIDVEILQNVDYIVALRQDECMNQPSEIVKLEGNKIIKIR
jgi:L-threonylcarbamoyladenylate synthase